MSNSKGFVIKSIKNGETSIILSCYLEEIGLKIYFLGFRSESELNSLINTSDYLLAAYHNRINDYGFQDTYFKTKSTGLILFNKPILII